MANILKLENITKGFDGLKAIDNLNLEIESGTVSTVIGPNGAGKTSLFNIICGYLYPDKGKIIYKEKDITTLSPYRRSAIGIGRFFQDIRVFKKLTLLENLLVTFNDDSENLFKAIFGRRDGKRKENIEIAIKWLDFVGLIDKKDNLAENLSWGQQKLLSIARLLCGNFDLLLIDEPVSGVNPDMIDVILEKIKNLKDLGKTIIVVEHDMDAVEKISDYIYYMESGKIAACGLPEEIFSNHQIMNSYIGIGDVT